LVWESQPTDYRDVSDGISRILISVSEPSSREC